MLQPTLKIFINRKTTKEQQIYAFKISGLKNLIRKTNGQKITNCTIFPGEKLALFKTKHANTSEE